LSKSSPLLLSQKTPSSLGALIPLILLLAALLVPSGISRAQSETWLCPVCQTERIERPEGADSLACPTCELTLGHDDLRWQTAYVSVRTRPTQVTWELIPECGSFRTEAILVFDQGKPLWIPWSAVMYYIPRQRICRLTSGREFGTPYSKGPDCPKPPLIQATIADSVGDFMKGRSIQLTPKEDQLSEIYLCARSSAALDSARARFIAEVEGGKHPRLPRSQPVARNVAVPTVPPSAMNDSLDVIMEARVDEVGRLLKVNRLKGSGNQDVDRAALLAVYRTSMSPGGEMGVGVPCSMVFHFVFNRGTATTDVKPSVPPMWREWVEPPAR